MLRQIVGYHQDEHGDWVADLECGHAHDAMDGGGRATSGTVAGHVRHRPPWINRPWVITAEGRAHHLGKRLRCKKCREVHAGGERG